MDSHRFLLIIVGAFMVVLLTVQAIVLTNTANTSNSIHTLLVNGKTASAINSNAAKKAAIEGDRVIQHVENQLNDILSQSRNASVDRVLICAIAQEVHISSSVITTDCPS